MATAFQFRQLICDIGKRMYDRCYVAGNDGNITARDGDTILCTPTMVSKGFMDTGMILGVDLNGKQKFGELKPSSEIKMHLEVYRRRPDVNAVVHAHPITATAFSVAGQSLQKNVLPEVVLTLGGIPVADYATPSTEEVPMSIVPYLKDSDAIILKNHGILCVGKDLTSAYHKLEKVEQFAQIMFTAMQLGRVEELTQKDVDKLMHIKKRMGI